MQHVPLVMSFVLRIAPFVAVVAGLSHQTGKVGHINEGYTFDRFISDFGRTYEVGSEEYLRRSSIFENSLMQIREKNSHAGRSWTADVYPFMDWTVSERARLHGYKPSAFRRAAKPVPPVALQTSAGTVFSVQIQGRIEDSFEADAPQVRDQGTCGSCWAVAAAEAVEARLLKTSTPGQVSVQALLDCVPNPSHCGGSGGCGGATPDLAFEFMRDHGVPLEEDLPYNPRQLGKCPLDPYPTNWARVTLTGWQALPQNQAQSVMQSIVNDGPVVVTVAAEDWFPYSSGVFDGCAKDTIPNHSVLARGYGAEDGKKYWLLQNSWGKRWGEQGGIRLLRHDDEDSWCGVDSRPQDGFACDESANQSITVCGNCGILSDPVVPQVGGVTFDQFGYGSSSTSSYATATSSQTNAAPEGSETKAAPEAEWHMPAVVQPDKDSVASAPVVPATPAHSEERKQPQQAKEEETDVGRTVGLGEGMYLPGKSPMDAYLRR